MSDMWATAALFIAAGLMLILGGVVARRIGSRWATAEFALGALLLIGGLVRLINLAVATR